MAHLPNPPEVPRVKIKLPTNYKAQVLLGACSTESDKFPSLRLKKSTLVELTSEKTPFQSQLMTCMLKKWESAGYDSELLFVKFTRLMKVLNTDGAILLGKLLDKVTFELLIAAYDKHIHEVSSNNFLHSFINFANHPNFLNDQNFNGAFLHPLLILMISYSMDGAIRVCDARGKDTPPIPVQVGDNMLHIDNTPFVSEYKINLCWRKGTPLGPGGQCFTFIPGTHLGDRNLRVDSSGQSFSTQNDGIFTTQEAINRLWDFQREELKRTPMVIECKYPEAPLSIVFDAGSLVHHRYRTQNETPRSCVILGFHRFTDDPGRIIKSDSKTKTSLSVLLTSYEESDYNTLFLNLLSDCYQEIADKLDELEIGEGAHLVKPSALSLDGQRLSSWLETTTSAPSITDIKASRKLRLLDEPSPNLDSFFLKLCEIMMLDKYGRLDLIFYPDGHEKIRKVARVRIREMKPREIYLRLKPRESSLSHICVEDWILTPSDLCRIANQLASVTFQISSADKTNGYQEDLKSINQLLIDLGELTTRCATFECLLSTALFLFWSADDLVSFLHHPTAATVAEQAALLFKSYVATTILVEASI